MIVGTQDGSIYVYDRAKDRGSVLKKKREKDPNQVFADILYDHGDAVSQLALKDTSLASASLDGM